MRMRKERWRKLLRFLICFILVFLILMYIPKCALAARLVPERLTFC